jgi:hypothetical protein
VNELASIGVRRENIIVWSQNGIEYLYPETILREIFGGRSDFVIEDDRIVAGDVVKTKNELSELVVAKLDSRTSLPEELMERLVAKVEDAIK